MALTGLKVRLQYDSNPLNSHYGSTTFHKYYLVSQPIHRCGSSLLSWKKHLCSSMQPHWQWPDKTAFICMATINSSLLYKILWQALAGILEVCSLTHKKKNLPHAKHIWEAVCWTSVQTGKPQQFWEDIPAYHATLGWWACYLKSVCASHFSLSRL